MKSSRIWGLVTIVVALAAIAVSAENKRIIKMAITMPNMPNGHEALATGQEGNPVTVEFPAGTKFGFVPTVRPDDESTVTVAVFDMKANPRRQLAQVDVPVGGDRVPSQTTPSFEFRIVSVRAGK